MYGKPSKVCEIESITKTAGDSILKYWWQNVSSFHSETYGKGSSSSDNGSLGSKVGSTGAGYRVQE